jgi:hypothetical protein
MKKTLYLLLLVLSTGALRAQSIDTPRPSPTCTINQKVGLNDFTVVYSRPSLKGRKAFGDVVPFDKLWRFGANMATTIKSSDAFSIQGNKIPAGEYSLFAIPGAAEWTLILNKTAKMSGTSEYKETEDQLRFKVKPEAYPIKTETFTLQFGNLRDNAAAFEIIWENTRVVFDITVEYDAKVMKQIDEVMSGPGAGAYYSAANYYFTAKKDPKKALEWINKSIEKGGEKYWICSLKAQIQAENLDYRGAVDTATKARDLAKADGDDAYVRVNEERIKEWSTKFPAPKPKK